VLTPWPLLQLPPQLSTVKPFFELTLQLLQKIAARAA
jgi:hypothetical protein